MLSVEAEESISEVPPGRVSVLSNIPDWGSSALGMDGP